MEHDYILYGAGELGRNTFLKLNEKKVCVIAFLDKKESGTVMGVPVLPLDTTDLTLEKKKEVVVVICLSDGMLHREVAETVYLYGFEKILFLPMEYQISSVEKKILTNRYNRVLAGEDVYEEIENYTIYRKLRWKDGAVIRNEEKCIVAWVGQEILFSEDVERWTGDLSKINIVNDGVDVNLNTYCWIHELYDFFDGKRNECNNYLRIYGLQQGEQNATKKIRDKERLYLSLKREIGMGSDFFIEAAPEVMWNEKGYFNLVGGHHRTVFQQHRGNVSYPVRIKNEDYQIWENKDKLAKIIEFIKQNHIYKTYVPIPHPYFANFAYQREAGNPSVLSSILQYLGPRRLDNEQILDVSQYEGYFARVTKRMCAQDVKIYNEDAIMSEFIKMVCDLLYIKDIEVLNNDDKHLKTICEEADIIFGMANTRMLLEKGHLRTFSGKLFIEFDIEDAQILTMIREKTNLNNYKPLHREVFQGKLLETGVMVV